MGHLRCDKAVNSVNINCLFRIPGAVCFVIGVDQQIAFIADLGFIIRDCNRCRVIKCCAVRPKVNTYIDFPASGEIRTVLYGANRDAGICGKCACRNADRCLGNLRTAVGYCNITTIRANALTYRRRQDLRC